MLFKKNKTEGKEAKPVTTVKGSAPSVSPKSSASASIIGYKKPIKRGRGLYYRCADNSIPAGDFIILQFIKGNTYYTSSSPDEVVLLDLDADRLFGYFYKTSAKLLQVSYDNKMIEYGDFKNYVGCVVKRGEDGLYIEEVPSIFDAERKVSKLIQRILQSDLSSVELRDLEMIYDTVYCNIEDAIVEPVKKIFGENSCEIKDIQKKLRRLSGLPLNAYIDKTEAFNEEVQIKLEIQKRLMEEKRRKSQIERQKKDEKEKKEIKEYIKL